MFSIRKLFNFIPCIIARKTLLDYCTAYPKAASSLMEWYHEMIREEFNDFQALKSKYGNCSLVGDDRVVFNIMGNKYRLVVRMVLSFRVVQVKWFGTHNEYDKIDVKTVDYRKK